MTSPAPNRAVRGLVCALLLAASASGAGAQSVRMTSGEHSGFTRLVLQSQGAIDWSLTPAGRERRLLVRADALDADPARIFRVIPRTRLADLRRIEGGLALVLNCDCEIRTDASAPGVVVLDIHDGPASPTAAARPAPAPAAGAPRALARAAGGDLARRMRASRELEAERAAEAEPSEPTEPEADAPALSPAALMEHLARQMSQAVAQGLLSAEMAERTAVMPAPAPKLDGVDLSNMRITLATDPQATARADDAAVTDACPTPALLEFDTVEAARPFAERHAALMRGLFGEFDLPDGNSYEALARLYLEHGFGAEARLMIENAPAQVAGRDVLLGLSDILEERFSNARLRLAEQIDCPGGVALYAALAGADPSGIARHALPIARAFDDLPLPLRRALGEGLVRRLIDAQAREAARMVADALRRAPGPPVPAMVLIDALLDAARGDVELAASRLDHAGRRDGATLVIRLRIALDRAETPAPSLLADAEAVAAAERATETGIELMSLLVRAHNTTGQPAEAFGLLDRLESWLPARQSEDARLAELREATWTALVANADDRTFLQTFFARADWRGNALPAPARLALAERLVEFGLTDPAAELIKDARTAQARRLRARLRLLAGEPTAALAELSGLTDESASRLRAQANRAIEAAVTAEPAEAAPPAPPEDPAPADGPEGVMLRGETLLSESWQLRESLQDLLQPD